MQLTSETYQSVLTLNHQGAVLAFATLPGDDATWEDVRYSVLTPGADGEEAWSPFVAVPFPTEVAPAGMRLLAITVDGVDADGRPNTSRICTRPGTPIKALSIDGVLYLFRQGVGVDADAILVDQFTFDSVRRALVPAGESRFQRSQLADMPASDTDSLGRAGLDGVPFQAATVQILLDGPVLDGFAAVFVPGAEDPRYGAWHLFVARSGAMYTYRIAKTASAAVDVSGDGGLRDPSDPASEKITPCAHWSVPGVHLAQPAAVFYAQQEQIVTVSGASCSLAKGARVMVAALGSASGASSLQVTDFAVGAGATLAAVSGALPSAAAASLPQPVALAFDGRNDSLRSTAIYGGYPNWLCEAWVRWGGDPAGGGRERVLLATEDNSGDSDVVLLVDDEGRLVMRARTTGGSYTTWRTVRCVPRRRWCRVGYLAMTNEAPVCYVNDLPVPFEVADVPAMQHSSNFDVVIGTWRGNGEVEPVTVGFLGEVGDVRLYNPTGFTRAQAASPNYTLTTGNALLWWSLQEGSGTAVSGPKGDATVTGATWSAAGTPSIASFPIVYRDQQLLDVRAGCVADVQTGVAPSLLAAADGRVHLYYRRTDQRLGAAYFEPGVGRVQQIVYWAEGGIAPTTLDLALVLTARLPGTAMNTSPRASFGALSPDGTTFTSLTLVSSLAGVAGASVLTEEWRDVPTDLASLVAVLNGAAMQTPGEGELGSGLVAERHGAILYDYAANVTVTRAMDGGAPAIIALDTDPGGAYASAVFVASGVDARQTGAPATLPEPSSLAFLSVAGEDPFWRRDPEPPVLFVSTYDGTALEAAVTVAPSPALAMDGDLTLEAWILPQHGGDGTFLSYSDADAGYLLGNDSEARPYVYRRGADGGPSIVRRADVPLGATWTHVAATYATSWGVRLQDGMRVRCGSAKNLGIREAITVEGWVRVDSLAPAGAPAVVASRWDDAGDDTGWRLLVGADGARFEVVAPDAVSGEPTVYARSIATAPTPGQWVHLAGSYAGSQLRRMLQFTPADETWLEVGDLDGTRLDSGTVTLWAEPDSWQTAGQVLVELAASAPAAGGAISTGLRLSITTPKDSTHATFRVEITSGHADLSVPLPSAGAHHLGLIWAIVNGQLQVDLYVDGVFERAAHAQPYSASTRPGAWTVGASTLSETPGSYFSGAMRDVRIWSRALLPGEILDGMTREVSGTEDGLLGAWPLAERKGGTAADTVTRQRTPVHARASTGTDDAGGSVTWVSREAGAVMNLWMDGVAAGELAVAGAPVTTSAVLFLGGAVHAADTSPFVGALDDVRIWRTRRWPAQITWFQTHPLLTPDKDAGLAAAWNMDEGTGTAVADTTGANGGVIVGAAFPPGADTSSLWVPTSFGGVWTLYLDGQPVPMTDPEGGGAIDLGEPAAGVGLSIGSGPQAAQHGTGLNGQGLEVRAYIAEVRVWSVQRSSADIAADFRRVLRGDEAGLAANWSLRDGSGTRALDRGPSALDGQILLGRSTPAADVWINTVGPPLRAEDPRVIDAGNGSMTAAAQAVALATTPTASDYYSAGRTRRAFGLVMVGSGGANPTELTGGQAVGEVELVYLGQIQFDPQLVGYIEGAPPVPSENLTVDSPVNPDRYVNTASLELVDVVTNSAQAGSSSAFQLGVRGEGDAGFALHSDVEVIDLPFAAVAEGLVAMYLIEGDAVGASASAFNLTFDAAIHAEGRLEGERVSESTAGASVSRTTREAVVLAGGWENNVYNIPWARPDQEYIQAARFYRPNNMAAAVVRSRTADLFAIRAKETGAVLGYQSQPSASTPADDNLLMFRLNPLYVKNGTLDGNIGYDRDIDYADATPTASYLKPAEAYRMRSNAERQKVDGRDPSELDFANTYVWTADGGLRADETELGAQRSDTLTRTATAAGSLGMRVRLEIELGLALDVGLKGGFDVTADLRYDASKEQEKGQEARIELSCRVDGEGFLSKLADTSALTAYGSGAAASGSGYATLYDQWVSELNAGVLDPALAAQVGLAPSSRAKVSVTTANVAWSLVDIGFRYTVTGDPARQTLVFTPPQAAPAGQYPVLYGTSNCPGKVREYRFSTIYQHPRHRNFDVLFDGGPDGGPPVIDPAWLASDDPDAVAMREARRTRNKVWRVLHRVTYVGRVPMDDSAKSGDTAPPTGLAPTEAVANPVLRPDDASMTANAWILATGLDGIDPAAPDMTLLSSNVDALLDSTGLTWGSFQREAYHARIVRYLQAVLASGRAA